MSEPKRYRLLTINETRIIGVKEIIPCVANAMTFDKKNMPFYDGETKVDWDGQRPMTWGNDNVSLIYVDEDGEEWCAENLKRVEDSED
jgi:hypothetical protein